MTALPIYQAHGARWESRVGLGIGSLLRCVPSAFKRYLAQCVFFVQSHFIFSECPLVYLVSPHFLFLPRLCLASSRKVSSILWYCTVPFFTLSNRPSIYTKQGTVHGYRAPGYSSPFCRIPYAPLCSPCFSDAAFQASVKIYYLLHNRLQIL